MPVGLGIGATHELKATISPTRAAGLLPIITVAEPIATVPGPPGMHGGIVHGPVILPTVAAGRLPIITVGTQFNRMGNGIGGWGRGVGVGAGG